jgi:hypothetical protein
MADPLLLPIEAMESLKAVIRSAARETLQEFWEEHQNDLRVLTADAVRQALADLYERARSRDPA